MKRLLLIVAMVAMAGLSFGQSYTDQFQAALDRNDTKAQRAVLAEWQQAAPDDVDVYIARWNYYVNAYMGEDQGGDLSARDRTVVDSGLAVIDEAISRYPDRLDLRFGKIYFLGQIMQWEAMEREIVRTLDASEQNAHRWDFNGLLGEGTALMQEGVQDYQSDMYAQITDKQHLSGEDTAMVMRIRRVAQRTLQVFPSNVDAMNMLAVSHLLLHQYEAAEKFLLRAEKIAPNNPVVLSNLVQTYTALGNPRAADTYRRRLQALE